MLNQAKEQVRQIPGVLGCGSGTNRQFYVYLERDMPEIRKAICNIVWRIRRRGRFKVYFVNRTSQRRNQNG